METTINTTALSLIFGTAGGGQHTIRVHGALDMLTIPELRSSMDQVISANAFFTNTGDLSKRQKAVLYRTETTVLDMTD